MMPLLVIPFLCYAEDEAPDPTPEEIDEIVKDIQSGGSGEINPWPFG